VIGTVLLTLVSHWRRKPGQLATLLIGLSLATALWTSVQAINAEARASYDQASATLGGGALIVLTAENGPLPLDIWVRLRRDGWAAIPGHRRGSDRWRDDADASRRGALERCGSARRPYGRGRDRA
jgi:hypothetical protein